MKELQTILRALIRTHLGLCSISDLKAVLEESLFSRIIPDANTGRVPSEVSDALLNLYEDLVGEGDNIQEELKNCLQVIFVTVGMAELDPIGIIAYVLHQIVQSGRLSIDDAGSLLRMPWTNAASNVTDAIALQMMSFRDQLSFFSHEASEGYVDSSHDDQLYWMAENLEQTVIALVAT
jgi:hypothetical protein